MLKLLLSLQTHLLMIVQVCSSCFETSSQKTVGVILLEGVSMRRRAKFCPSASTVPRCHAALTLSLEQITTRCILPCAAHTQLTAHVKDPTSTFWCGFSGMRELLGKVWWIITCFLFCFPFFRGDLLKRTNSTHSGQRPVLSSSASWDEKRSLISCMWVHFLDGFAHSAWTAVSPILTFWGQGCMLVYL